MTWEVEQNIRMASKLCIYNSYEDAIEHLSRLIDAETTKKVDLVHYIHQRAVLYLKIEDFDCYLLDKKLLENLITTDIACHDEYFTFHEWSEVVYPEK